MALQVTNRLSQTDEAKAKAAAIRATLKAQQELGEREITEAQFGLSYGALELYERIARLLYWRPGHHRVAQCALVSEYRRFIPDDVLLRWEEAKQSGRFSGFCIAWPVHERVAPPAQIDPWLIGWVGSYADRLQHGRLDEGHGGSRGIVLAYWDDTKLHPKQ